MSSELAQVDVEVQQPTKNAAPPPGLNPIVGVAWVTALNLSKRARRISWRTYAVGGGFTLAMLLYMLQWQKAAPPKDLANPYDARQIPGFDEAEMLKDDLTALSKEERNLSAFLNEERQRQNIAIALAFRSLATFYIQAPGHACNGLSEIRCLNTFDANRISGLQELGDRKTTIKEFSPLSVLKPLLDQGSELDRVEGLRLAKILAKPAQQRAEWEQWEIDLRYPVLNSGIPTEELQPRPMLLAKLLKQSQEAAKQVSGTSPEAQARLEYCLSLSPEEQEKRGGCN